MNYRNKKTGVIWDIVDTAILKRIADNEDFEKVEDDIKCLQLDKTVTPMLPTQMSTLEEKSTQVSGKVPQKRQGKKPSKKQPSK